MTHAMNGNGLIEVAARAREKTLGGETITFFAARVIPECSPQRFYDCPLGGCTSSSD